MCFGAQGTMMSHEMYWQKSEELQHFLGMVLSVCAGILTPAACKKQVLLRQALQNGDSKLAVGHGCRVSSGSAKKPRISTLLWKLALKNALAANPALLMLSLAAAGGQDFCLCWGSVGNRQF